MAHDAASLDPEEGVREPSDVAPNRSAAVVAALVQARGGGRRGRGWSRGGRVTAGGGRAALPPAKVADAVGAGLVALLAAWIAVVAGGGVDASRSVLWLLAGATIMYSAGRWLAEREPLAVHRLVALGVSGAMALTLPGLLRAGGAPLGYANANATLAGLGVLAALAVAAAEQRPQRRAAWTAVAGALVLAVIGTGSLAGGLCLIAGASLLAASALIQRPAVVVLGGAILVALVLGGTVAIAHGADPAGLGARAGTRGELWAAAADLTAEHPLRGVGQRGFESRNPVSGDPDLRWAHHEYLQVAAETGVVGLALLLAIIGWGYARLALASVWSPHRAALGATALTMVALHAAVDHVLHHAALVLTLAVLVGSATGRPLRSDPDGVVLGRSRPPPTRDR